MIGESKKVLARIKRLWLVGWPPEMTSSQMRSGLDWQRIHVSKIKAVTGGMDVGSVAAVSRCERCWRRRRFLGHTLLVASHAALLWTSSTSVEAAAEERRPQTAKTAACRGPASHPASSAAQPASLPWRACRTGCSAFWRGQNRQSRAKLVRGAAGCGCRGDADKRCCLPWSTSRRRPASVAPLTNLATAACLVLPPIQACRGPLPVLRGP